MIPGDDQFVAITTQFPWVWGIVQDWNIRGYQKFDLSVEQLGISDPLQFRFSTEQMEGKRVWITWGSLFDKSRRGIPTLLERVDPIPGETIAGVILETVKKDREQVLEHKYSLLCPFQLAISWYGDDRGITIYRPSAKETFAQLTTRSFKEYLRERAKLTG